MMHKRLVTLSVAGVLLFGMAGAAQAQDQATPQEGQSQAQPEWRGHHGRPMDPDAQLAHMTRQLGLTQEQQAQIKPVLVAHQQQMQALFQDQSLSPEDRRTKAHAISDETHQKIASFLTDEQKQKQAAMEERMHRGPAANGQPAAPPQS